MTERGKRTVQETPKIRVRTRGTLGTGDFQEKKSGPRDTEEKHIAVLSQFAESNKKKCGGGQG